MLITCNSPSHCPIPDLINPRKHHQFSVHPTASDKTLEASNFFRATANCCTYPYTSTEQAGTSTLELSNFFRVTGQMSATVTTGVRFPSAFLRPCRAAHISRRYRLTTVRAASDGALEVCVKASITVPDRLGDCKLSSPFFYLLSSIASSQWRM